MFWVSRTLGAEFGGTIFLLPLLSSGGSGRGQFLPQLPYPPPRAFLPLGGTGKGVEGLQTSLRASSPSSILVAGAALALHGHTLPEWGALGVWVPDSRGGDCGRLHERAGPETGSPHFIFRYQHVAPCLGAGPHEMIAYYCSPLEEMLL